MGAIYGKCNPLDRDRNATIRGAIRAKSGIVDGALGCVLVIDVRYRGHDAHANECTQGCFMSVAACGRGAEMQYKMIPGKSVLLL